jgi:UDP-N-acetylglucosamine 2-epimerase (non-hydrolysing)
MNVLFVFGTRPEAIKLIPLIIAMKGDTFFDVNVCVTAQHREMLDQVLSIFEIQPEFDLNVMTHNQTLAQLTAGTLDGINRVVSDVKPDLCLIQGDTTTVFTAALACYYNKVKVGHIEAGLRSFDKFQPFPEEINRTLVTHIADYHFAPTKRAKNNLLHENIRDSRIFVTGNTVIDALHIIKNKLDKNVLLPGNNDVIRLLKRNNRFILVTSHRRENFGDGIESICNAIARFAVRYPFANIIFPVHLNPNIRKPVHDRLDQYSNVHLLPPLDYISFVALMSGCYLVLTDSGGVQEEAPSFGKPVLVMRQTTERPEAVESGLSRLVGSDEENILMNLTKLMEDEKAYSAMSNGTNPYGDGNASERIIQILKNKI